MFGASPGVRLEKREERGLVRTRTLRRWGIPNETPRTSPVNAQNPGHDGGAGLQPQQWGTRTIDGPRSAVVRSLISPEGHSRPVHQCGLRDYPSLLRLSFACRKASLVSLPQGERGPD